MEALRLVLWNIHRGKECRGRMPAFLDALAAFGPPDLLCLVEADSDWPDCRGFLDLAAIAAATGLRRPENHAVARPGSHGHLGLLLLASERVAVLSSHAFWLPSLTEPRGLLLNHLEVSGRRFWLALTHLSRTPPLRFLQALEIRRILARETDRRAVVLAGDLNEWLPFSPSLRILGADREVRRASFPAKCPVLHLDRILAWPGCRLEAERVEALGLSGLSDHLPLAARVALSASHI